MFSFSGFLPAEIFLLSIAFLLILMLLVYLMLKREQYCCQLQKHSDNGSLLDDIIDDGYEPPDIPPNTPLIPPSDFIAGNESDDMLLDNLTVENQEKTNIELPINTIERTTSEKSIDSLKSRKSRWNFLDGTEVKLSLTYSKLNLFLMVSINEVTGVPPLKEGGYEYIRISVVLLPDKKYNSKSRYEHVTEESTDFHDSFKFSNISREKLFSLAFRFRLYGKKGYKRVMCLGETIVQLADVAQRSGGFVTRRKFKPCTKS